MEMGHNYVMVEITDCSSCEWHHNQMQAHRIISHWNISSSLAGCQPHQPQVTIMGLPLGTGHR